VRVCRPLLRWTNPVGLVDATREVPMIRLHTLGNEYLLELDSATAAVLQSLLCQARPRCVAELGALRVVVVGDAAHPEPAHVAVDEATK